MKSSIPQKEIKNILIRSTNWLGDAVMTIPALRAIKETYPNASTTLMAPPLVCQMLESLPCIDSFMVYDKQKQHYGLKGFLRAVMMIKKQRFDLAVLLQNAIEAALLTFFGGVPRRMGYDTDGRGFLLTHKARLKPEILRKHQKDYYLGMLSNFDINTNSPSDVSLSLPGKWKENLKNIVSSDFLNNRNLIVGINPGAHYGSAKRWEAKKFAKVADNIAEKFGVRILVTGGPKEVEIANKVEKNMTSPCLNLAGKTSIPQLISAINLCGVFITNDSGPMHIASALGKRIVAIFGSTDPATTSPVSSRSIIVQKKTECSPCLLRQCSQKHHNCMRLLSPEKVTAAVCEILRGCKTQPLPL